MKLKADWFNSTELKGWLSEKGEEVDFEEMLDFFSEIFNLFVINDAGRTLLDILQNDWLLFSERADIVTILEEASRLCKIEIDASSKVSYSDSVMAPVENWKIIKNELKSNRRFLMDQFLAQKGENWNWFLSGNNVINKGKILYRGRTNTEENKPYETEDDLSAPPLAKATSGRVNPFGISHLYLTDSPETVLYELRSVVGDQISIGEFEIKEDLNVVDFTKHEDLYDIYSAEYDSMLIGVQKQLLFKEISEDLCRPVRRYDNPDLDYLPTQLVCEYIRIHQNEGGIIFQSSRRGDGHNNIVVFDKSKARLAKHYQRTVGQIDMKFVD